MILKRGLVIAALVCVVMCAVASASAVASGWTTETFPSAPVTNPSLTGVSCATRHDCVAVGIGTDRFGDNISFAADRSHKTWTIDPLAVPSGTRDYELGAVSCPGAKSCNAVGRTDSGALAEHWDGTTWTIQNVPLPSGAVNGGLAAISCWDKHGCMAVGFVNNGTSLVALVETFDGSAWNVAPAPSQGSLASVACTAADACVAVGSQGSSFERTFATRWNGTTWTTQTLPAPPDTNTLESALNGVSCVGDLRCSAVGLYGQSPVNALGYRPWAIGLGASGWTHEPAPTPVNTSLTGVSCVSHSLCTAVGLSSAGTVAMRFDGASWSQQTTPTDATQGAVLASVSCPGAKSCTAVGGVTDVISNTTTPLVEHWSPPPSKSG